MINLKYRRRLKKLADIFLLKRPRGFWWAYRQRKPRRKIDGVYISSRADRYGSNAVPWISAMALASATGQPLLHNCTRRCFRFRHTVMHAALVELASQTSSAQAIASDQNALPGWLYGHMEVLLNKTGGVHLPEYLESSGLKAYLHERYRERAQSEGWSLPWGREKSITIHVRLDDLGFTTRSGNRQNFIGEQGLTELMHKLHDRFPQHVIRLITSPNREDLALCESIIRDSGLSKAEVVGNWDMDLDVYVMMHADILVMSKSTFPFVPWLLHQGDEVYSYTRWTHLDQVIGVLEPDNPQKYTVLSQKVKIL